MSVAGGVGFSILNSILGGQALASIANISWTLAVLCVYTVMNLISQILVALEL